MSPKGVSYAVSWLCGYSPVEIDGIAESVQKVTEMAVENDP